MYCISRHSTNLVHVVAELDLIDVRGSLMVLFVSWWVVGGAAFVSSIAVGMLGSNEAMQVPPPTVGHFAAVLACAQSVQNR